jgi:hypothetical protein
MVVPLIMAGMAAASAISAAKTSSDTNKQNAQISAMNYAQQQQARSDAMREAQRQRKDAQLGTTDANGNRTYFVPGQGWVTELTNGQKVIQKASEAEQTRQLTEEASRNERNSKRGNERRNREDTFATEADRELRSVRKGDEAGLRDLLLARGSETRADAADAAGNAVSRQAVRGGGTNAAALMQGARAASDASSARQAGVDAQLQARQTIGREFNDDRASATGMLDYFRKMSTGGTAAPNLAGIRGPANNQGGIDQSNRGLLAVMNRAPQLDYQSANHAMTDGIAGVGSAIGGYNSARQGEKMQRVIMDSFG